MTMPASVTILICVLLAGCSDYLEHKDTVRFNSGDAVATNAAIQIPDPWPPASRNANLTVQGARGERAVLRYRTFDSIPAEPSSAVPPSSGLGTPALATAAPSTTPAQ